MHAERIKHHLSTPAVLLYAVGFLVTLLLGLAVGRSVGKNTLSHEKSLAEPPYTLLSTPTTSQRILLVIGVDRLAAANPRLESVWLVSYIPGQSDITLLPVYPSLFGLSDSMGDLAASFTLDRHGEPAQDFLAHLQKKNLWWSSRLLVDEIGLIAAFDYLSSQSPDTPQFESALVVGDVPRSWEEPRAALEGQLNLLESACSEAKHPPTPSDLAKFLKQAEDHLRADFDLLEHYANWYATSGRSPLHCDFPLQTHLGFEEAP